MPKPPRTADGHVMRPSSISTTQRDRQAVQRIKTMMLGTTPETVTNSKVWRAGLRALAALDAEKRAELLAEVEEDRDVHIR